MLSQTNQTNVLPVGEIGNQMVLLPYRPASRVVLQPIEMPPPPVARRPRKIATFSLVLSAALGLGCVSAHAMLRSLLG